MSSFWNTIDRPIISPAPMEDVTATASRELLRTLAVPAALGTRAVMREPQGKQERDANSARRHSL